MKFNFLKLLLSIILVIATSQANAEIFGRTGNILRIITDVNNYGGCMIYINSLSNDSCPNGWVSLDCKALTIPAGEGNRNYASALLAAALNKQVTVYIDNTKIINSYCVVNRLDLILP